MIELKAQDAQLFAFTQFDISLIVEVLFPNAVKEKGELSLLFASFLNEKLEKEKDKQRILIRADELFLFVNPNNRMFGQVLSQHVSHTHKKVHAEFANFLLAYHQSQQTAVHRFWFYMTFIVALQLALRKKSQWVAKLSRRMRLYLSSPKQKNAWFWLDTDVIKMTETTSFQTLSDALALLSQKLAISLRLAVVSNANTIELKKRKRRYNQIKLLHDCFAKVLHISSKRKSAVRRSHSDFPSVQLDLFTLIDSHRPALDSNSPIDVLDDWLDQEHSGFFSHADGETFETQAEDYSADMYVDEITDTQFKKYDSLQLNAFALAHKAKRNMLFYADTRILTPELYKAVYQKFNVQRDTSDDPKQRSVLSLLQLCMLTGLSIEQMTTHQSQVMSFFTVKNKRFYSRIDLDITKLKHAKAAELGVLRLNQQRTCHIQVNRKLIHEVARTPFSLDDVKASIAQLKKSMGLTYLSLNALESSASVLLTRHLANRLNADVLGNVSAHQCTPIFYASHDVDTLQAQQNQLEHFLTDSQIELAAKAKPQRTCGTQIAPTFSAAGEIIQMLQSLVLPNDFSIENFNAYTVYIWHLYLLLTGARPVAGLGKRAHIDLMLSIICVRDKNNRQTDNTRIVPICHFLRDELAYYFEFQQHFLITHQYQQNIQNLKELRTEDAFALYAIENQQLKPASFRFVKQVLDVFQANWGRHVARSYFSLHADAPEHLVNQIFGHERPYFECLGTYSSTSLAEIKGMSIHFDSLAQMLGLNHLTGVTDA